MELIVPSEACHFQRCDGRQHDRGTPLRERIPDVPVRAGFLAMAGRRRYAPVCMPVSPRMISKH
jgi:hypothetical protein